jgi:hypothetical protein
MFHDLCSIPPVAGSSKKRETPLRVDGIHNSSFPPSGSRRCQAVDCGSEKRPPRDRREEKSLNTKAQRSQRAAAKTPQPVFLWMSGFASRVQIVSEVNVWGIGAVKDEPAETALQGDAVKIDQQTQWSVHQFHIGEKLGLVYG